MKHGKNPTRAQKISMTKEGLNYKEWLIMKDTSTELVLVHRDTEETKTIIKE